MNPLVLSFVLGLAAAAANIFGGAVIVQKDWDHRYLRYFIALGSGFMLATAIAEMIPESLKRGERAGLLVLAGYLLVHFFEHTVSPHFHFGEETHAEEFAHGHHQGFSVLVGLMIHTFFDGIAITSGFLVSHWLGMIIFLAVFLHKIPEGFTVASVMLASGKSRRFAWGSSMLLGAATLAGVLAMAVTPKAVGVGLPLAAGVTLYVAASDLIPEVNREPGIKMALVVFLGVATLFLLDVIFHVH
jgi:ZIP family zinc transporter/zinc and cadmium transporter